ncbi:MAG TPA: ABC transporter permease [Acidobacteriota bacterium]|nr:ABC transporter permease [Acidobacteriota bacterium]
MSSLLQDLKYGVRSLVRAPVFSGITVLTLTLAIGVNSAIFSMVSVIYFSDLPFQDTDDLVLIFMQNPERGVQRQTPSLPDFLDYREQTGLLRDMAALEQRAGALVDGDEPARVVIGAVTTNAFRSWGVLPTLGRGFVDGEDSPGAERAVMLSHAFWERRYGLDSEVIGREMRLDGYPTVVVGIVPEAMEFGDLALIDVWTPLELDPAARIRDQRELLVTGRLIAGATIAQAHAEFLEIGNGLADRYPETNRGWSPNVQGFYDGIADDEFWAILLLLTITVALVMLIACSNVATMTLARATGRTQELAVRAALGAGRARILRQLITESVLLSGVSGLLGLGVAHASLIGLTWIAGGSSGITTFFSMLEIDQAVLAFTLCVALGAPVLFGLVPALRAARTDLAATLKEGGRSSGSAATLRGRRLLVAIQVSLAITLMVVAGLIIRSLLDVRSLEYVYDPESLLTLRVELPQTGYPDLQEVRAFRRQVVEQTEAIPGVVRAAWVDARPLADPVGTATVEIEGAELRTAEQVPWAFPASVEPAYFDIMRIRPIRGRLLGPHDDVGGARVALVNAEAVERFWGEDDPVGGRVRLSGSGDWLEVVGVVSDEVYPDTSNPVVPSVYLPLAQHTGHAGALLVETFGDPLSVAAPIRRIVWGIDPEQPVADVRTQARIFADGMAGINAVSTLFGAFALARILASVEPTISAVDPLVYGSVGAVLLGVAGLSAWIPARRATRVEPASALRTD